MLGENGWVGAERSWRLPCAWGGLGNVLLDSLQAEVPEGHQGCTRFLPLLCRERKHERKQWKHFEQAGTLLMCVLVPKKFPAWGAWYWTRTAVFTWQFIDEQTHVIIIKNPALSGSRGGGTRTPMAWYALASASPKPSPNWLTKRCGMATEHCGCHLFHTFCFSASH